MATGLSLEAARAAIGIGPRTLFTWQNQHEELRQAIQEGRQLALLYWERLALSVAAGATGNAGLISLALRNRSRAASGWHDAQRLEHTDGDGEPVQVRQAVKTIDAYLLTRKQRQALREAAMATQKLAAE